MGLGLRYSRSLNEAVCLCQAGHGPALLSPARPPKFFPRARPAKPITQSPPARAYNFHIPARKSPHTIYANFPSFFQHYLQCSSFGTFFQHNFQHNFSEHTSRVSEFGTLVRHSPQIQRKIADKSCHSTDILRLCASLTKLKNMGKKLRIMRAKPARPGPPEIVARARPVPL
jgi:hypothetical protein